jgi:23S rRNA pseudouridine1911/1915/1917 synthase
MVKGEKWDLEREERGKTFAALVREHFPGTVSWKAARNLIQSGKVFLDGRRITNPSERYDRGTSIEIRMAAPRRAQTGEIDTERILHVDPHVVVVDKPPYMITVRVENEKYPILEERIRGTLQRLRKGSAQERLFLVHRLDRLTSGILVFARNPQAQKGLKAQFKEHSVEREYRAIVHGQPRSGRIESWIVPDRGDGFKGSLPIDHDTKMRGKKAITHIRVLETFAHASYISCRLETGRTHQIRVHLSSKGFPLVGDNIYLKACEKRGLLFTDVPKFNRVALHAISLGFMHPITQEKLNFSTDLPDDFQRLLEQLRAEGTPG